MRCFFYCGEKRLKKGWYTSLREVNTLYKKGIREFILSNTFSFFIPFGLRRLLKDNAVLKD